MLHLEAHLRTLAHALGAEIIWDSRYDFQGNAGLEYGQAFIRIPDTKTRSHYFLSLHELGHVALRHIETDPASLSEAELAQKEGEAWVWALDHALVAPAWEAGAEMLDSLATYTPRTMGAAHLAVGLLLDQ